MTDWVARFSELALHISAWSKDPSTKVGAVIVGPDNEIRSTGYNGMPPGIVDRPEMWEKPRKYLYVEHAERNAIYFAAKNGANLSGCTLYTTMFPCADCARGIVRSGITRVYCPAAARSDWAESNQVAMEILQAAGVELILI